jgi:hypothetical protein
VCCCVGKIIGPGPSVPAALMLNEAEYLSNKWHLQR